MAKEKKKSGKKGLFSRLVNKADKKMKAKSEDSCCCSGDGKGKGCC